MQGTGGTDSGDNATTICELNKPSIGKSSPASFSCAGRMVKVVNPGYGTYSDNGGSYGKYVKDLGNISPGMSYSTITLQAARVLGVVWMHDSLPL